MYIIRKNIFLIINNLNYVEILSANWYILQQQNFKENLKITSTFFLNSIFRYIIIMTHGILY